MKRLAVLLIVAIVLLLGLGLPQIAAGQTKSFYCPSVDIDARINSAGNMSVVETRTYDFTGTFHGAEQYIPLGAEGVPPRSADQVSVGDERGPYRQIPFFEGYKGTTGTPGTFMTKQADGVLTLVYFYSAGDEAKDFVIKYRVKGAVTDWSDTAELAWAFIGNQWKVRTGTAAIRISLPDDVGPGQLKVWAHGPLQGESKILAPNRAQLSVTGIEPGQGVAARLIFPASVTPGAPKVERPRLKEVLAEEAALSRKANEERARRKKEEEQLRALTEVFKNVLIGSAAVLPLLGLVLLVALFFKYGREPRPTFTGEYLRELPSEDPPALVGWIVRQGKQTTADFVATILDLGRRKYLKLEQVADESGERKHVLVRTDKGDADLRDFEKGVIDLIFGTIGTDGKVPFDAIIQYAKDNPSDFRGAYATFQSQVKTLGDSRDYFKKHGGLRALVVIAGLFVLMIGFASNFVHPCLCAPGFIVGALLIALNFTLKQWTPEGMEQLARWRALRKFLKDFSRLEEAPPASIEIWEHFLVYAVVLGVAKEVMDQLKVALPQVATETETGFAGVWFGSAMVGGSAATPFDDLDSSLSSAVSASTPSSAGGTGGGFSGGGGGGDFGGGGGGDAW